MTEIKRQKLLVDSVLCTVEREIIEEWADLTAEDYWYALTTRAEYLTNMLNALRDKGVNVDSIQVMHYVDQALNYMVSNPPILPTKGGKSVRALSLFSGIGGMDLAAEWAGIETVAFCEYADFPRKVLNKHWPNVPIFKDVKNLDKAALEKAGVIDRDKTIKLIHGGFPCQPYSVSGEQKAKKMTVISGQKCLELSKNSGPIGLLEKMLLTSPIWNSTVRYLTWKTSITKQQRLYFQLWPSVPNIKGLEHSLLPTPTASMWKGTARSRYLGGELSREFHARSFEEINRRSAVYQPRLCRAYNGIPDQVDRVKSLGNAVVPQQIYPIFKAIMEIERMIES